MRKLMTVLMIAAVLTACRSGKDMNPVGYTSPPVRPEVRETPRQPEPVRPAPEPETAAVIPVVEERFQFERKQDELDHQINSFFVILGSFRVSENANKYKNMLENSGFTPVILLSETGLHRVSVGSFSREADARQRVLQIRGIYPEYHDAWLLIRKTM
jgi:cell division protein FtsN